MEDIVTSMGEVETTGETGAPEVSGQYFDCVI
jgi:hypothetical protein